MAKKAEIKETDILETEAGAGTKSNVAEVKTKLSGMNKMIISLAVVAIVFFAIGYGSSFLMGGKALTLSSQQVGAKVVSFVNSNLLQPGVTASLANIKDVDGVYEINLSITGPQGTTVVPVFASKGGEMLFGNGISLNSLPQVPQTQQPQTNTGNTVKSDKPAVELFVMSFCPYGNQAENLMKPVADLLASKANIIVRFIASVTGDTVDSVQSLHGANEAKEDLRQVCIQKYYSQPVFWSYVSEIDENCYPLWRNETALDACWKTAAQKYGINVSQTEGCAYSQEGLSILKFDEQLASQYGVTGSPTLIINGQLYSGDRTSEAYKQGICSAFTTQPAECSGQAIASNATVPSGSCGA